MTALSANTETENGLKILVTGAATTEVDLRKRMMKTKETKKTCKHCPFCTRYVFGVQCDNIKSEKYGTRVTMDEICEWRKEHGRKNGQ